MSYFIRWSVIKAGQAGNPWRNKGGKFSNEAEDEDSQPHHFTGAEKAAMKGPKTALKAAIKAGKLKAGLNYTEAGVQEAIARAAGLEGMDKLTEGQANYLIDKYLKYTDLSPPKEKAPKAPKEPKEAPKKLPEFSQPVDGGDAGLGRVIVQAAKAGDEPEKTYKFVYGKFMRSGAPSYDIISDAALKKLGKKGDLVYQAAVESDAAKFSRMSTKMKQEYIKNGRFGRFETKFAAQPKKSPEAEAIMELANIARQAGLKVPKGLKGLF